MSIEVKSKMGKIFEKHNPLEEHSVKIYEIDPYFYEYYEEKILECMFLSCHVRV